MICIKIYTLIPQMTNLFVVCGIPSFWCPYITYCNLGNYVYFPKSEDFGKSFAL